MLTLALLLWATSEHGMGWVGEVKLSQPDCSTRPGWVVHTAVRTLLDAMGEGML